MAWDGLVLALHGSRVGSDSLGPWVSNILKILVSAPSEIHITVNVKYIELCVGCV